MKLSVRSALAYRDRICCRVEGEEEKAGSSSEYPVPILVKKELLVVRHLFEIVLAGGEGGKKRKGKGMGMVNVIFSGFPFM